MRMSVSGPTSWKTTQHEPNQQFCLFSKDNSILVRLFGIFFITFSAIRYIPYQEMKIIIAMYNLTE